MKLRTQAALALGLIAIGAAGWTGYRAVRAATATATEVSDTPVTRVKRGPVAITVSARGSLQGGNPEMLYAPAVAQDSLVVTRLRQPGELVEAGDVVAEFDTTQQEYNLREAEADLAEAGQKVAQTDAENQASDEETRYSVTAAQNTVKVAELELRRNGKNFAPAMVTRQYEIALEAARNRLKQAEQDLANKKTTSAAGLTIQRAAESRAKSTADMARRNIDSMSLKAKSSGYVALQTNTMATFVLTTGMTLPYVQLGDTVRPGMAIAQLFDLKNWEVNAQVPETDRGHLSAGQPVSVAVMALAGKTFPGHIASMGNANGSATDRTYDCRIALDAAGPELRPGMSSYIVITAEKLDDVLWAPSQALFDRDGRPFVYLKTASGFTPKDVTLVKRSESQAVLKGVNEGDIVALANPAEQSKPAQKQEGASKALPK
jgi:HlyD family secretion protein